METSFLSFYSSSANEDKILQLPCLREKKEESEYCRNTEESFNIIVVVVAIKSASY
jgi:hypothetical protein